MTEQLCERCGQPITAGLLERHPEATLCAGCLSRVQQVARRHRPKDDLREQREELPEALRRVDPLWEGD
jgi:RNA polymerase-binding transcription factor DksA